MAFKEADTYIIESSVRLDNLQHLQTILAHHIGTDSYRIVRMVDGKISNSEELEHSEGRRIENAYLSGRQSVISEFKSLFRIG